MAPIDLNLTAYRHLFAVETAIREVLIERLEAIHGPRWYETVLTLDVRRRAIEKRDQGDRKAWASRGAFHPVYFLEFMDLVEILEAKRNQELGTLFVGGTAVGIVDQLRRLGPIRNAVAHHRLIRESDLKQVEAAGELVRSALGPTEFDRLAGNPPSQLATAAEMSALASELETAAAEVAGLRRIGLPTWALVRSRWWLEDDWQVDASAVRDAYTMLESYRAEWDRDTIGGRGRAERWKMKHWNPHAVVRAVASLRREKPPTQER